MMEVKPLVLFSILVTNAMKVESGVKMPLIPASGFPADHYIATVIHSHRQGDVAIAKRE